MLHVAVALLLASDPPAVTELKAKSLRLIGRFSGAHACPTEPRVALTNAHVVDLQPFDAEVPTFGYAWSDGNGGYGFVSPIRGRLEAMRDLAAVEPYADGDTFRGGTFVIAPVAPKVGDRVYLLGYDWRKPKTTMSDDVIEAKVTNVVAAHVLFFPSGKPGSSGSCIVNEAGQVVAINEGSYEADSKENVGIGVGVWGSLKEPPQ